MHDAGRLSSPRTGPTDLIPESLLNSSNPNIFFDLAITPDLESLKRYDFYIRSLIADFPQDKSLAETNGTALGNHLSRDLLSDNLTRDALLFIDRCLHSPEASPAISFALCALTQLKERFDLMLPFTRRIAGNAHFRAFLPEIHSLAVSACKPVWPDLPPFERGTVASFAEPAVLKRFHSVKPLLGGDSDSAALFFIDNGLTKPFRSSPDSAILTNCIEAAYFKIYILINSNRAHTIRSRASLVILGRWIGSQTVAGSVPIFSRYLDLRTFLLFCYTHSRLCSGLPFLQALFASTSPVFNAPNPWILSILSVLSGIVRLPYLRQSLTDLILSIFKRLGARPSQVDPYPLPYLCPIGATNADFLYPSIDFTFSFPAVSIETLFHGNILPLFYIVHRHLDLAAPMETLRSRLIQEISVFVYAKVDAIAHSAAMTAFHLSLKDFARARFSGPIVRFARALLRQLVNALSMTAVALMNDFCEVQPDYAHRNSVNRNASWIDLLIRQLAFQLGWRILQFELRPVMKLRDDFESESDPFWDVKSFPPAVALKLPEQLWPSPIRHCNCNRPICSGSMVVNGLFECHAVPGEIKRACSRATVDPLSICSPDIYPKELQIDLELAQSIFSHFTVSEATGETEITRRDQPVRAPGQPASMSTVATLIFCFPPGRPIPWGDYGRMLSGQLVSKLTASGKRQLQRQAHSVLWQQMPDLRVFAAFVECDLIEPQFIEPLVMKFVDSPVNNGSDFVILISVVYELVHSGLLRVSQIERLIGFLAVHSFDPLPPAVSEQLKFLRDNWIQEFRTFPPRLGFGMTPDAERLVAGWKTSDRDRFIKAHEQVWVDPDSWSGLIGYFSRNSDLTLIEMLSAILTFFPAMQDRVLTNFLKSLHQATSSHRISLNFSTALLNKAIRDLPTISENSLFLFGGFLKDTVPSLPTAQPFVWQWFYCFPLVASLLLQRSSFWNATASLIVGALMFLAQFPFDWGNSKEFRIAY
jgi:hypothetical protein